MPATTSAHKMDIHAMTRVLLLICGPEHVMAQIAVHDDLAAAKTSAGTSTQLYLALGRTLHPAAHRVCCVACNA